MEQTEPLQCHICQVGEKITDEHGQQVESKLVVCTSCHKYFCISHTSEFDPSLCSDCVSFSNTVVTKSPLKDSNGVTHQGSQLILTGEAWMRSRDVISMMTDIELEAKLISLKKAVHEAEMILDYRRIIYNQVENEKGARLSKKLGRLRLISAVDAAHKATVPQPAARQQAPVRDALKALGGLTLDGKTLTKDQIANVLIQLAKAKGASK